MADYPASEAPIADLLGFNPSETPAAPAKPSATGPSPANLPVVEVTAQELAENPPQKTLKVPLKIELTGDEVIAKRPMWIRIIRGVLPYIIVFAIGVLLYYFFFSKSSFDITKIFNFNSNQEQSQTATTDKAAALKALETQRSADYYAYMSQFFFSTSDLDIVKPDTDYSHNGLTNFEKYLLQLNPKVYDTLGRGTPDGATILQGVNPMTGLPLTEAQQKIVDQYIDLESINNRLAQGTLDASQQMASATNTQSGQVLGSENSSASTSAPASAETQPVLNTKPTQSESQVNVDTSKPGLLEIPSIKVSVPLQWPTDAKGFDKGLCDGVIHYPGTALPGDIGTMYVSGHSSNYPWIKCKYNYVFSHLGDIKNGDSIVMTVTRKDGKTVKLHYVVKRRGTFKPTDQMQFANTSESLLAISTCWPVGETTNRLVLFAPLTQTEYLN